ncbi:ArdC family protein [Flexithrix dorotheae]|uniref:ArdC family protein n=1 Tax=Flexithrix dorotheae TaxID=70993 RepID=UPI00037D835B|nr:zincin-like metallopeptidase domain-containing protein [Flexithrix dorotheae]
MKNDVYQIVTAQLIEQLEKGTIPWKQPWNQFGPAANYLTKKPYRGINALILNSLHFTYPFFLTFKQIKKLGGKVQKGAKSILVVYWNFVFKNKDTGEIIPENKLAKYPADQIEKKAFLKYYRVFNISCVEDVQFDIPELTIKADNHLIWEGEQVLRNMQNPPALKHEKAQAFYNPKEDFINMPAMELFPDYTLYLSILYHEIVHASGHASRLDRKAISGGNTTFASEIYSKEELLAEMGACFLCGHVGIQNQQTLEDSAAYIQGWLDVLKSDNKLLIEAAAQAQKAVDYILA